MSWLDAVTGIEEYEDVALDAALVAELESAAGATPPRPIRFSTPTFKDYASTELKGCGKNSFPSFSITAGACGLNCDHCRAEILKPMLAATSPAMLDQKLQNRNILIQFNMSEKIKTVNQTIMDYALEYKKRYKILNNIIFLLSRKRSNFREHLVKLQSLNPLAILERGYSVTRSIPEKNVITNPCQVSINQKLEILLAGGVLICSVKGTSAYGKEKL